MKPEEFSEFEERVYLNPTTSREERLSFIDTLRETQARNTQQINTDTYNLGTHIPSNLGGLSGSEDAFIAKYQTPQTNQMVADLRTAAQQTALNQALSNLQNAYKKRYNDAMLNYQKRAATSSTTPSPSTNGNDGLNISGTPSEGLGESSIAMPANNTITVQDPVSGKQHVWAANPDGSQGDYLGYLGSDGKIVEEAWNNAIGGTTAKQPTNMGNAWKETGEVAWGGANILNFISNPSLLPKLLSGYAALKQLGVIK